MLSQNILERLFAGGERAHARGDGKGRPRPENLRDSAHAYWSLPLHERDALHVRMRQAEAAGAVMLAWSKFGGDDRPLEKIALADVGALARFLGRVERVDVLKAAEQAFAPWRETVPALGQALDAWRAMRQVRGCGPEDAGDFVAAARVIVHMRDAEEDRIVRQVSRVLFRDSKRLEKLVPQLSYLQAPDVTFPRHPEEVLAQIGLRKEPAPFLLAGVGDVVLQRVQALSVVHPYLGVSAPHITGFVGAPRWVMSVENLTTFHMIADKRPTDGLVLYTGGMPSPTWRRAYRRIVDALPGADLYHWGDIDPGGFRIAACLAGSLDGRPLHPWEMAPHLDPGDVSDKRSRKAMVDAARRAGWFELADKLAASPPFELEQEDLDVSWPGAPRRERGAG